MPRKKNTEYDFWLPREEMEALARCFLPAVQAFYESEEGMREFEAWKKTRQEQRKEQDSTV